MQATNIKRTVDLPFAEARERVIEALAEEGFGILTEIDVQATLKKKLDIDFKKYSILGACNPPLAHQALSSVDDIGVLLPCNVVVYDDDGTTVLAAVDPISTIASIGDSPELNQIAEDVRARLERALKSVG